MMQENNLLNRNSTNDIQGGPVDLRLGDSN